MGYYRAGFDVVGVDIKLQPRYPFEFHQGDALEYLRERGHEYDAIHASPPCQAYSTLRVMPNAVKHPELIDVVREALSDPGKPWVIENVVGAPLRIGPPALLWDTTGVLLCGTMFALETDRYELRRHRLFESSAVLPQPQCRHNGKIVIGFYGDHARIRKRREGAANRGYDITGEAKMSLVHDLLGITWMNWDEVSQAIPPAYTEYIGRYLLEALP